MIKKENIDWVTIQKENKKKLKGAKIKVASKKATSEKKKNKSINVYQINKLNKESKINTNYDQNHFAIHFDGARLLSINQIFHILQKAGYQKSIYNYKQTWQDIVQSTLKELKDYPLFNKAVELTLFRQAPRLVDEDALSTMFKYLIDAIKKDHKKGFLGVISDDNKKIVRRIVLQQEKGDYAIGLKIVDISKESFSSYSKEKLLNK